MDHQGSYYLCEIDYDDNKQPAFNSQTYHASSDDNGGKVLKIGHIPPNILVDGEDDVTDPSQEGNQQKNLRIYKPLIIMLYTLLICLQTAVCFI